MLQSERLVLKPLSFNELLHIKNNEIYSIETCIESEAIHDFVKVAISKKIEKMRKVSEYNHLWYTYWLIINKANGKGIGFIGFKGIPDENGYVEVGYSISHNYRRKGFMTEALSSLVDWSSKDSNCNGVIATKVLKTNVGSNGVLNHCNFILVDSSNEFNTYMFKFNK